MPKRKKYNKRKNLKPYTCVGELVMSKKETNMKDLKDHIIYTDKFFKWVNTFPYTWLTTDKEILEPGRVITFRTIFPPMTYKFKDTKVYKDYNKTEFVVNGWMNGHGKWEFFENENEVSCRHTMILTGKNRLMHKYFRILEVGHDIYWKIRLSVLRRTLVKLHKKRCQI